MSSDEQSTCALWYWRYGASSYYLCDTEEEAAAMAVGMADEGVAAISGIQYADGRTVAVDDWEAYADEQRRHDEAFRRAMERAKNTPKPATRKITEPFEGRSLMVAADAPDWLGGEQG